MIQKQKELKFSDHISLYDILIPQDSRYRQLLSLIDFDAIRPELLRNYSSDMGRTAIDPIILFKHLLLKTIHPASDRDLIARSYTDMSYKFFLGLSPEEEVIDPSLLTVFRRRRVKGLDLMDILLRSTIDKAKALDLISSKKTIIDATHTISVFRRYNPAEAISRRSRELIGVVRETGYATDFIDALPSEPAKGDRTCAHMVACAEALLKALRESLNAVTDGIGQKMNYLQEALDDIADRAMACHDKDARSGYKSTEKPFTGYKVHFAETEEGFITAGTVTPGDRGDGGELPGLLEKTERNGIEKVEGIIADAAYGTKENIETCETRNGEIKLVAPLQPSVNGFRDKDDGFSYNKDAGTAACPAGELAVKKRHIKENLRKKNNACYEYHFDVEKCRQCPLRGGCYKEGAKTKTYSIRILCKEHKRQMGSQNTDELRREMRKRKWIEAKNSELKNRHGMGKAISFGLESMEVQAAVAMYCVNLKRIMKLTAEKA